MKLNGKLLVFGVCFLVSRPLFAQNVFLELNLSSQPVQSMMHSVRPRPNLEIFRVIERAGNDTHIGGIVLNIALFQAGQETLWELRSALTQFKAKGKKICAFIGAANLDLYCLATVADKIIMDEQGTLTLMGYVWGRGYVQHSLEKLGIGVRELRYLEYKSAAETYTRDSLSEADRRQYGEVLDDITNLTRDTVTGARSWTADEFNAILDNEFLFSAKSALERNLVDRIGRKEAVIEAIREISDGKFNENFVIYGDPDSSLSGSKSAYGPKRAGGLFSRPPIIAVIYANGTTDMERGMAARTLARTIQEVAGKKRVKALVIRINSPGGSAEAADYIAEAISIAKERIPVVVSMGAVAASGGYWASMNASHITASPVTLTGSIGVIGSWFYDKGLNDKLGLTVDIMQRGDHADLLAGMILPHRDLNPEEEARYKNYMLDLYGNFVAKVAASRNMDIERAESLAQGRVYSGLKALNAGLIDSIGGIDDAVHIARNLAGIAENKSVIYREFPKPRFRDKILDRLFAMGVIGGRTKTTTDAALFLADLFLPAPLMEDIRYRIAHNGQVMPILPLGSELTTK